MYEYKIEDGLKTVAEAINNYVALEIVRLTIDFELPVDKVKGALADAMKMVKDARKRANGE